jgi:hypothetical protein
LSEESKDSRRSHGPADPEDGRTPSPDDERRGSGPKLPDDAPEADVLEQSQPWGNEGVEDRPRIPDDAPEADVLEQSQPTDYDEEGRDR